ncbi:MULTISPECIES: bifunctional tetrahydrofolate synthase/dihydrofolate synthase [unclassified Colwellia]|uniref:bifunctional tetrahydrofolate synthase/dihydrofolate synthase n=1 Tax=unclassified Colwellia TaxID=196834 RepID=UPI0015F5F301|nr:MULTISPECIES: bifunctional tetrahydrofolate synthase/dihydrofolate synthase [unclassified Colwellia]MBA6231755.1 bifunctional tetrahydrofolate synthase/dihydrofolate synthase [Colwellia sp. MB02u-7]MBA6235710.1 bifunctional tetrahydrofolate synthase/dihydrofolate synthase [Colwellia sp. MB02u-11]MBA6254781.1 bifunctional tetrahydrofolate synthase/dihydrofolate synthase [Colwellia sp. MB3u-28]MBA6259294.1 bifunctional tetrahydrofolate synthase/dihydrofolate synthase [Colwellia sp. MB3u-41]MB
MQKNNKSHSARKSLAQWLSYLETIHLTEIDLGLTRISHVAKRLNIDFSFAQVITVAGTNGKGTTCAFIENALLAHDKTVAVYSSPHIENFNERLRINNIDIDDQSLISAFELIEEQRDDISLTYYEYTTLAAFIVLMAIKPAFIILEVGLGGRLDATNLIDADIAVITTIDLDHQAYLGDNRESIGFEKAGIMRANQKVVIGDTQCPKSVLTHAKNINALVSLREHDFSIKMLPSVANKPFCALWCWKFGELRVNKLAKPFIPQDNVATALTALALLKDFSFVFNTENINALIQTTKVAGRTELFTSKGLNSRVLLDVGHNPQAARYLVEYLKSQQYNKLYAVTGMLKDKDIANTFRPLSALVDHWYLGGLSMPRGASAKELAEKLSLNEDSANCFDNITQAFRMANKNSTATDLILVFGSFYTVAEVRRLLL